MDQKSAIEIGRKYLVLLLQHNYPVKQMILYGSYARGNHNPDSESLIKHALTVEAVMMGCRKRSMENSM